MDVVGQLSVTTILKLEVITATVLTLGLLSIVILKKEELKSDIARKKLKSNIKLLWTTLLVLFTPLIFFIVSEIIKHVEILMLFEEGGGYIELLNELELIGFFLMNIGLILSHILYLKIRGRDDASS